MPDLHTHTYNRGDADVDPAPFALPAGAGQTVSDSIDLAGVDPVLAPFELEVQSPALTTGELPDGETVTYDIEHSDDDLTFEIACGAALVVTGAAGAGAEATTGRARVASTSKRYVRLAATNSGAGDQSNVDAALKARF